MDGPGRRKKGTKKKLKDFAGASARIGSCIYITHHSPFFSYLRNRIASPSNIQQFIYSNLRIVIDTPCTMLRQGLRTSARVACRAMPRATASLLSQQGLATRAIRPAMLSIQPWKTISPLARYYSSEMTAEAQVRDDAAVAVADEPANKFADLEALGVNQSLLRAIIQDMKYDNMTPVQAKTINPALKGTDM